MGQIQEAIVRQLVTREDYFDAAMKLLATEGAGRLKIAPLCRSLKVTSGSFYGYFGSMDGFVEQLLAYWEETQTERVVRLSNAQGDPAARIHAMKELAASLPHGAEAAIRSWAHTNERVAAAQKRVDERRVSALADVLQPAAGSRREAKNLALMGITLLVGLQQWRSPVTMRDFNVLFNEFEKLVLSRMPQDGTAAAG